MQKLSDSLSINDWKKIAGEIQKLELPARYYYDGYKLRNQLGKLKTALLKHGIDLIDGYTSTDQECQDKEVGLATLLENISSITAPINYEQAAFYEKIYKLAAIGIKTISFNPTGFTKNSYQIIKEPTVDENMHIIKIYTDGNFDLTTLHIGKYIEEYEMSNMKNTNFILQYDITYCQDKLRINNSHALITSFNGNNFPAVKEIKRAECPKFSIVRVNNATSSASYKQEYKVISTEDIRHRIGYPSVTRKEKYYYKK